MSLRFNFSCLKNVSDDSITDARWIVDHPTYDNKVNGYTIAVIITLFMVIGVPWNLFVICTILWKKLYNNPTIALLLNLAITNFLLGVLFMPFNIITGFSGEFVFGNSDAARCHMCQMTGLFLLVLPTVSVHTLFLISVDRFIYLKEPIRYSNIVTVRAVLIVIFIIWVISIVSALPPLFGFGEIGLSFSAANCAPYLFGKTDFAPNFIYIMIILFETGIPLVVVIAMHACILHIARKSLVAKLRRRLRRSFTFLTSLMLKKERVKVEKKIASAQVQLAKLFVAILLANVITWLPVIITGVYAAIADVIPSALITATYLAFLSQTVIHPILQAYLVRELREIMSNFFKRCKRTKTTTATSAPV